MSGMSNFPCQDLAFLETVPSVPITIGITITFPKVRDNCGKFNIPFFGPKVGNKIEEPLKTLNFQTFKRKLKVHLLDKYNYRIIVLFAFTLKFKFL